MYNNNVDNEEIKLGRFATWDIECFIEPNFFPGQRALLNNYIRVPDGDLGLFLIHKGKRKGELFFGRRRRLNKKWHELYGIVGQQPIRVKSKKYELLYGVYSIHVPQEIFRRNEHKSQNVIVINGADKQLNAEEVSE